MQAKLQKQLSPADAEVILGRLPERIRAALTHIPPFQLSQPIIWNPSMAAFSKVNSIDHKCYLKSAVF